jgi:hypothetical protein
MTANTCAIEPMKSFDQFSADRLRCVRFVLTDVDNTLIHEAGLLRPPMARWST